MPASALEGSAQQVEMMLAHELAHVCRRDLLWNWLFIVGEVLFFFHLLVWLARKERRLCCEAACDQLALKLTSHAPHEYGSMLVDVVAQAKARGPVLNLVGVGMFETANTLKRRLKAMNIKPSYLTTITGVVLVALAASLLVPVRLVAETSDETIARLKDENAKLKKDLEALRQDREATERATADAFAKEKREFEELQRQYPARQPELERSQQMKAIERAKRDLEQIRAQYTETHPLVVRQHQVLQKLMGASRDNNRRIAEQRALLEEEVKLAEQQAEHARRARENGKAELDQLLAVRREVLDLKLQLAELQGNKAEQQRVIEEQLNLAEKQLAEEKKRVAVGTQMPGAEIPVQREVLRLKRSLMQLE